MLADFKKFILRGNVLDLAVAVVIGAAFKTVIDSFVNDLILQFIGGVFGKTDFSEVGVIDNADGTRVFLRIGSFVTAVVGFLVVAAALFVVVKAYEAMQARRAKGEEPVADEPLTVEGALLTEIRDLLATGARPSDPGTPGAPGFGPPPA